MAYLLSISFTTPFCHHKPQFEGTCTRRVTGGVNSVTSKPGKKHLLYKYSIGGIVSSNGSCHCNIFAPTRQCLDPVLCHVDVCSSIHVLISGFWMGPDIEDGWGFVEAYVHRIY